MAGIKTAPPCGHCRRKVIAPIRWIDGLAYHPECVQTPPTHKTPKTVSIADVYTPILLDNYFSLQRKLFELLLKKLTEEDVRRIVREELSK